MSRRRRRRHPLEKRAAGGFRGYPMGTVAFYGPDNLRASKVAVGVLAREDGEVTDLKRWFSEDGDVRHDEEISDAIAAFLKQAGVKTVAMSDRIMGCPHEEGIDYPRGEACPQCPFWANRDRFTHEELP